MNSAEQYVHFDREKTYLSQIVLYMRECSAENQSERTHQLIDSIRQQPHVLQLIRREIQLLVQEDGLDQLLYNSDIPRKSSFWSELFSKMRHRILPRLKSDNAFRYRLLQLMDFNVDAGWLKRVRLEDLHDFNTLLFSGTDSRALTAVLDAISVLSYRLAALSSEEELIIRHKKEKHHYLFFEMQQKCTALIEKLAAGEKADHLFEECWEVTLLCKNHFEEVKKAADIQGANVQTSFLLTKGMAMIKRLRCLLKVLQKNNEQNIFELLIAIAREEQSRQHFFRFFKNNIQDLSYQISEHKSHSGEHYIATDRKAYGHFFTAALGAGLIVSFLVFVKAWIHQIGFPPLWEALFFSINYAIGFLLIQFFHFTLATKQPAMTAASLAKDITGKKEDNDLKELAITIARVCHTQTISFIGNLLVVFPLPFVFAWAMDYVFGYQLYSDQEALNVITNQHPWLSGALWFAVITGIYLFLSGLLAGYTDNRMIYSRVPERIRQHNRLKQFIGEKNTHRLANYLQHNAGSLAGNIALGFFLGTATFIGIITGLPFDIRHITFAAGSFSSALYYALDQVTLSQLIIIPIGILLIGFVNFATSFSLAFFIAIRSRGIVLLKNPRFLTIFWAYFRKYPFDFFIAPWRGRKKEDLP